MQVVSFGESPQTPDGVRLKECLLLSFIWSSMSSLAEMKLLRNCLLTQQQALAGWTLAYVAFGINKLVLDRSSGSMRLGSFPASAFPLSLTAIGCLQMIFQRPDLFPHLRRHSLESP